MQIELQDFKDYIIPLIAGLVAWFTKDRIMNGLNLKQKKSEVEDNQIKVVQGNLDLYQEMLNDLDKRYKIRLEEMESDLNRFKELTAELSKIIEDQKAFITKQAASLRKYIKTYGELTSNS